MSFCFGTKHPIICSPMNGVSDVALAVACQQAGILPSLVPYCYSTNGKIDIGLFETALADYARLTNFGKILVACDADTLADPAVFSLLIKYRVATVEILDYSHDNIRAIFSLINKLKKHNIIAGPKLLGGFETVDQLVKYVGVGAVNYVTIKGPNGAGRGIDGMVLQDEVIKIKQKYPSITVVVSGGINTAHDVKQMLEAGADAVSIGTMFCASKESKLSMHSKQQIIDHSYADVGRLSTGAQQKALIFNAVDEIDDNNTKGLIHGIKTGTQGHIFIGTGIDHIQQIKTVQDIVDDLTRLL
jgi:NAD(P)H-dependent flavin oxidoreductase YrpB (nitropropane dioxygenase family)